MRICIVALGSRGDVQPCVALARGLRTAGHEVKIATDTNFESFVTQHGIEFSPMRANSRAFHDSTLGRKLLEGDKITFRTWRALGQAVGRTTHGRFSDCLQACENVDVILVSPLGVMIAHSVAEKLQKPLVRILYAPPGFRATTLSRPGLTNWVDTLRVHAVWSFFRSTINRGRSEVLGLPPLPAINPLAALDQKRWPVLCAYGAQLCPPSPRLDSWWHVTGFWFLNDAHSWQPPQGLTEFLAAGPPPVYVGFGSMTNRSPRETAELVVAALTRSGRRGILATGWGGINAVSGSDQIYVVDDVPHEWLFSRVAAVVHHGGAGTTAAGLRAGKPSVIVPFAIADQRLWGERVHALGVGPAPISRKQLSVERLSEAIVAVARDGPMRLRATALGARIRSEDGVARAIEALHPILRRSERAPARLVSK